MNANVPDQGDAGPPQLPDGASHPQPKPPSKMEWDPWKNPIALIALPLTAEGAAFLRQPIAAFGEPLVGGAITLTGFSFFMLGFSLASCVQLLQCRDKAGGMTMSLRIALSFVCLVCLFGAVLFAVSPLLAGKHRESPPLVLGRVGVAFLFASVAAALLPRVARPKVEDSPLIWALSSAYWLCYVPAAALNALRFGDPGWR